MNIRALIVDSLENGKGLSGRTFLGQFFSTTLLVFLEQFFRTLKSDTKIQK